MAGGFRESESATYLSTSSGLDPSPMLHGRWLAVLGKRKDSRTVLGLLWPAMVLLIASVVGDKLGHEQSTAKDLGGPDSRNVWLKLPEL